MKPYTPRGTNPCEDYYMQNPYMTMRPGMSPTMPMMPPTPPMMPQTQSYMPPMMPPMMHNTMEPNYQSMHCPQGTKPYIVRPGDTLYALAYSYETTVEEILKLNPQITNPNLIYPGQIICMPYYEQCDGMMYTVVPGDNLYTIAMKYGITVDAIIAANPQISNPNLIFPGQEICLPSVNPCPNGQDLYVVKPTDSLTDILTECKVALHALKAANPQFNENNIIPGMQLCIIPMPCEPQCPKCNQKIIPKGVNGIVQVAEYFVVSTDNLLKYNPNYPPCYFIEGHPICVPPEEPV